MKKVFLPLILVILILSLSISAAATEAPGNPYLSGGMATWSSSPDAAYYIVNLYKDGSFMTSVTTSSTTYNFTYDMQSYGDGNYYFEVCAAADSSAGGNSLYVFSNDYNYSSSGSCVHDLTYYSFSYPTCTEKGDKGHYECSKCGKWYWDYQGTNEIVDHSEAFNEALGHSWGEWTITKQPTTEAEGEAKRTCKNDSTHVETTTIPKLKASDEKPKVPTSAPETTAPTTAATTAPTQPSSAAASEAPTVAPTVLPTLVPTNPGNGSFLSGIAEFIANNLVLCIVVLAAIIILIPAIVILIVLLVGRSRKKKREMNRMNQMNNMNGYGQPFDDRPYHDDMNQH